MNILSLSITQLVSLAGWGQIVLATGSIVIPGILNWRRELAQVRPLNKQIFWTHAAYILVINLCFGLVSALCSRQLTDGSLLATLLSAFITVYWVSRVLIQFFYFDRGSFPRGAWFTLAEVALVSLFIFLSVVYGLAFVHNYRLLS